MEEHEVISEYMRGILSNPNEWVDTGSINNTNKILKVLHLIYPCKKFLPYLDKIMYIK